MRVLSVVRTRAPLPRRQNNVYMTGAMAELCAKMISPPRMKRTTSMGISHQRLVVKKANSSLAITNLRVTLRMMFMIPPACLCKVPRGKNLDFSGVRSGRSACRLANPIGLFNEFIAG